MFDGVCKAYGKRTIFDGLSATIRRGERWCVMGRNGAGKTTLLKMVAGALKPDSGDVRLGASVEMGYFAQQALDILNPDLTIEEQLQKDFPQESIGVLRSLAGAFQFSGDDVQKKVRALSGGEKTRLVIARMLLNPPNFLVLDEPTNHLDLFTKEMLIEALKEFDGTMLFVSHDRAFLRGIEQPRDRARRARAAWTASPTSTRARTSSTWRGPATKRRECIRRASHSWAGASAPARIDMAPSFYDSPRATAEDAEALGRLGAMLMRTHYAFDAQRFLSPGDAPEKGYASFLAQPVAPAGRRRLRRDTDRW